MGQVDCGHEGQPDGVGVAQAVLGAGQRLTCPGSSLGGSLELKEKREPRRVEE